MLKLNSNNVMAIFHLAKKAKKKIPLYEERNANKVNVPFIDEILKKTRYLTFYKGTEGCWNFTGAEDNPVPTVI
ncbi:MAG: hypothetical protein LH478_08075 [Chitinophagaceae bacterium]|nr:hypothetical protein [Chitinophagaceae bacterium]